MRLRATPALLELAPGEIGSFEVTISNDGDQTLAPTLTISGVDPDLLVLPSSLAILEPGESSTDLVEVRIPEEATAGEQRLGIQVSDPDGLHRAAAATVEVEVGDRPPVAIETMPAVVRGRRSAALMTVLHNRSQEPLALSLSGESAGADVRFLHDEVVLEPGEDLEIPTEIEAHDRSWFRELRHGAMIQVRGRGAPRSAPATLAQRPAIPPLLLKVVAAVTVLALFATSVVVVHSRITDDDLEMAKTWVPAAFDEVGRVPGIDADPAAYTGPASVSGSVEGPSDPEGTSVVIERISYGDEGTTEGEAASGGGAEADGGVAQTRLAAMTPVSRPMGVVVDRIDTETDERGEFRFTDGLRAPGFYRVTASRPGFEIESRVVNLTAEERDADLEFALEPASGGISGRVTDTNGNGIGGAEVTITDGDLVYSATSATEGTVGSWSVSGIATPQTYQVIVSERGYATATAIVELEGGEVRDGVNLQLEGGMGTIRGRLSHRGQGVGGVTVELEGNPTERQTTTLTEGNLAGTFDFPALSHGTYKLTFSADGWLTQTAEVVVDRGDVQVDITDLRPSTATIEGVATQEVAPGGRCEYPDPDRPQQRANAEFQPCGGVGITVEGDEGLWRTTSSTGDGSFQLSGIEPGEYLVRFERFGHVSQYFEVDVDAGDVLTLPPGAGGGPYDRDGRLIVSRTVQLPLTAAPDPNAGEVQGLLSDAIDPTQPFAPPSGTRISIDDQPDAVVEYLADGEYRAANGEFPEGAFRVRNLTPGAHTLRIEARGYDTQTTVVRISSSEVTDIGITPITRLGTLTMSLTSGAAAPVGDADVFVMPDPEIYNDTTTVARPDFQLGAGVRECERAFDPDFLNISDADLARWFDDFSAGDGERTFQGLCATTTVQGLVEFRRTFATGNYVMVTPANAIDPGDPESPDFDPELAAGMLPMDHEQLVRRLEIQSGSTVPLDLPLQRFPVVTGVVRAPSAVDDGLITVEEFTVEFEAFDPASGETIALPEDAPRLRVSGGEADEDDRFLERGRYRIDRIPPDDGINSYAWRMVINSPQFGSYIRDPSQPGGQEEITGLTYNQTLTINALLLPDPEQLTVRLRWRDANGFDRPVEGGFLRLRGISNYETLEEPPYFRAEPTTCPGDNCESDNPPFDYTSPNLQQVVSDPPGLSGLWFSTSPLFWPDGTADDEIVLPPFYRPSESPMEVEIHANGFDSIEEGHPDHTFDLTPSGCTYDPDTWEIEDPDDPNCTPFVHEPNLEIHPLDVEGEVRLAPSLSSLPDFLANAPWGLDSDADILVGLEAELSIPCDEDLLSDDLYEDCSDAGDAYHLGPIRRPVEPDGAFGFTDLTPGEYTLRIHGEHITEQVTQVVLEPDSDVVVLDEQHTTVDRLGVIRVDVEGYVLDADEEDLLDEEQPLPEVTATLERTSDGGMTWDEVEVLTTCEDEADDGGGPDCSVGRVTFDALPQRDGDDPLGYRVRLEAEEYATKTSDELDLSSEPYPEIAASLERFGEVRGTALTRFGAEGFRDEVPLEDATVQLLAVPSFSVVATTTSGEGGDFRFEASDRIPPLADSSVGYLFRIDADGHQFFQSSSAFPVPYDQIVRRGEKFVQALDSTFRGKVESIGEEVMHGPAGDAFVQVRMYLPEDAPEDPVDAPEEGEWGDPAHVTTTEPGAEPDDAVFEFVDIPGGAYVVRFEAFEDQTAQVPHPDFATLEVLVDLGPGETFEPGDAYLMPYAVPVLEGFVTGEPWSMAIPPTEADQGGDDDDPVLVGPDAASVLAGATLRLTQLDDQGDPTEDQFETEADEDGYYAFTLVPSGNYRLEVEADGYETRQRDDLELEAGGDAAYWYDPRLSAEPIEVSFQVRSAIEDLGTLEDVEVTPEYLGPLSSDDWGWTDGDDEGAPPPGDGDSGTTDESGWVQWLLPPGVWRFVASGTDVVGFEPRPHVPSTREPDDPDEENVSLGAGSVELTLALEPYVSVHGVAKVLDGAGAGAPAEGVTATLIDGDDNEVSDGVLYDPPETDEEGLWRVWLTEIPDPEDGWRIRFDLAGYEPDFVLLDGELDWVDDLDAEADDVELEPGTRDVQVSLTSLAGDEDLAGLVLTADRTTFDEVTAAVEWDADEGAFAVFEGLAFGDGDDAWTVSSAGGPDLDVPHTDFDDAELEVPIGSGTHEPDEALYAWDAMVTGTVQGENYDGADEEDLVGLEDVEVSVEITQGIDSDQDLATTTDSDGRWTVGVSGDDARGTVSFEAPDYASLDDVDFGGPSANDYPFDGGVSDLDDIVLTALPRDLVVTLTTAVGEDGEILDGLELSAVPDDDELSTVDGVPVVIEGDDVTVTFEDLAPHTWTVVGEGGEIPHGARFEFSFGPGEGEVDEQATFAALEGVVLGRDYVDQPVEDWVELGGMVIEVAEQDGAALVSTESGAGDGAWLVGVPDGMDLEVEWSGSPGYDTENPRDPDTGATVGSIDDVTGTQDLDAVLTAHVREVTVQVTLEDEEGSETEPDGIEVTASADGDDYPDLADDGFSGTTDDGFVTFNEIAPGGRWTFTATDDECSDEQTITIPLAPGSIDDVELTIDLDCDEGASGDSVGGFSTQSQDQPSEETSEEEGSVLGTVTERRSSGTTLLSGVRVVFEGGDERIEAVSTDRDEAGNNLSVDLPAGTWEVWVERNGEAILHEEAFEVVAGVDTPLELVVELQLLDVAGEVVSADGRPLEGAQVTAVSSEGSVTVTTDEDGRYELEGLDNRVTWAVTFAPPEGLPGSPVTRYVALSGDLTVELALNQQIPSALGQLDVRIIGGLPGVVADLTLAEATPYPTLNPEGFVERSLTLDGEGSAVEKFERLVPGDGRTVPQDRFTLEVEVEGYASVTRAGLDVAPGETSTVTIDLASVTVLTREVELSLSDDDGAPIVDRTVRLSDGERTLTATASPDHHLYRLAGVEPGSWTVEVEGFEPATIEVPPGEDGTVRRDLRLVRLPEVEDPAVEEPGTEDDEPEAPWDLIESPDEGENRPEEGAEDVSRDQESTEPVETREESPSYPEPEDGSEEGQAEDGEVEPEAEPSGTGEASTDAS